MRPLALILVGLVCQVTVLQAQEPVKQKDVETLPPPTLVAPTPVGPVIIGPSTSDYLPYVLPSSTPRTQSREVWQYYGVDSRGRWVPSIIYSPSGSYNYYTGRPYPWTTTHPQLFMPYVVD